MLFMILEVKDLGGAQRRCLIRAGAMPGGWVPWDVWTGSYVWGLGSGYQLVPWFLFMSCLLGLEYPKVSCADTCAVARLGLGAQLGADPFLSSHGLSVWLPPQSMASSWQWLFLQRLASP